MAKKVVKAIKPLYWGYCERCYKNQELDGWEVHYDDGTYDYTCTHCKDLILRGEK